MQVIETKIQGVFEIEPKIFKDDRGYFFESFNENDFNDKTGAGFHPIQDNESKSCKGVLRGLHFQCPPYDQAKLVRVVSGAVYDVAVDIRKDSPTYGQWTGIYLSTENHKQFFLPRGMAHGFLALTDDVIFQYKCDNYYNKASEGAIAFNDSDINIDWGGIYNQYTDGAFDVILSDKDRYNKNLCEFDSPF